jgi:L-rhamnose mutarotase
LRYAWTMRLKPDCADAYIARHRELPSDMRATLNRAGYRDYTIFRQGDLLVGTFECDDLERMQQVLAADEAALRWRAAMAELVESNVPDPKTGMLPLMVPVFHHAGGDVS